MADHVEFFDTLYQQWAMTTWAKDSYWMPEEDTSFPGSFNLIAVNPNTDERKPLAAFMDEADAEFVAGLHGAIPDLIRHLGEATDRADRLDEARDAAEGKYADVLLENAALREEIRSLEGELDK
ncbi:hypothetical protein SEA_YECEY3_42 [Mycobacterium phage Yecey3]|uniref:Uncharacterized protein n=1 Tax=Mycobacterium phage Yecey3 TaxID=2656617 RepID=A0A649V9A8_9CAUD|nr:hypothetical protein KIV58_gp067 [Mycobacterium phage Yecey3]QGJ88794.1 hypothetical protein SEA_YECEY3_42 [Mycobacterium phage Yecey3]